MNPKIESVKRLSGGLPVLAEHRSSAVPEFDPRTGPSAQGLSCLTEMDGLFDTMPRKREPSQCKTPVAEYLPEYRHDGTARNRSMSRRYAPRQQTSGSVCFGRGRHVDGLSVGVVVHLFVATDETADHEDRALGWAC